MASPIKKPKFGGKRKAASMPPSQKKNEEYGMKLPKKAEEQDMEPRLGNREFGFIQSTPKLATAGMSGRGLPSPRMPGVPKPPTMRKKAPFKAKAGKKVF